ncbi:MAG: type II toxin-antitoxin system HicA family toxin [Syntrophomonadaceae bacterium]|jgi:predicted RNA binding protein YcfA (HicA-like mRNA interferase family)
MPPIPVISGQEALKAFNRAGWVYMRRHGSHMILTKSGMNITLSIPDHKELDTGTLRSLIRKSGLTVEEFINLIG